jgi:arginyl-tRNA synthetase
MVHAQTLLSGAVKKALLELYNINAENVSFQKTRKEFEGDFTLVTFPFIKESRKSPEQVGQDIGEFLKKNEPHVTGFNVVKGFLNISLDDAFWLKYFNTIKDSPSIGLKTPASTHKSIMLEYSSPNTNKPLHLGHIRNNLLGYSVAKILEANGHNVIKVNLVNDRGIHICKSMLAWQKWGNGETPESSGEKGDHLVGKYYVLFDKELKKQLDPILNAVKNGDLSLFNEDEKKELEKLRKGLQAQEEALEKEKSAIDLKKISSFGKAASDLAEQGASGKGKWKSILKCFDGADYENADAKIKEQKQKEMQKLLKPVISVEEKIDETWSDIKEIAQRKTSLMQEANDMLREWEAGNKEVLQLWKTMNDWVYDGFSKTYALLGVEFDKMYFESNTYLLGKEVVADGLTKGVFYRKPNNSVAIDLTSEGLDEKVVLRSDGTSVYITQDLGTAIERFKEYPQLSQLIYTVGNEQDFHFKVLFKILERLGHAWARECYHLSYGMVELPEGKMKSREGTVVDADDLLDEMFKTAEQTTRELGKVEEFNDEELKELYKVIGLGALKYFILKVDPKKKMLFDPKESIDFNGHTGPFVQYTHARIKSVLRKADVSYDKAITQLQLNALERELLKHIYDFEEVIEEAGKIYNPALIANYVYELAKAFNRFFHDHSILKAEEADLKIFRIQLAKAVGQCVANAMGLLGIRVPERM